MGLNLLVGYVGLISLGQAGLFAAGAYAAALLATHVSHSMWLGLAAGILLASLVAAVFALISLRSPGVYFILITLALSQLVWAVVFNWRSLTRGDDGIRGIGSPEIWYSVSLSGSAAYYYLALLFFLLVLFVMWCIVRSPFGKAIVGIRENESRMRHLGYDVWRHKFAAFMISGAFSGLAGVLWAYYAGYVSPADASFSVSVEALLIVILGGGSLLGPVVGTMVVVIIKNVIGAYTGRWLLVMGVAYVLCVLFTPKGIVSAFSVRLKRRTGGL